MKVYAIYNYFFPNKISVRTNLNDAEREVNQYTYVREIPYKPGSLVCDNLESTSRGRVLRLFD